MSLLARRLLVLGLLVSLGLSASRPAAAVEPGAEGAGGIDVGRAARIAVDVFPIRFGGVLRLAIGSVLIVPATIFSGLTYPFERNPEVFRENAALYLDEPFDYTFRRPLGEDFAGS